MGAALGNDANVVANWLFSEANGLTVADSTANARTITSASGTNVVPGLNDNARDLTAGGGGTATKLSRAHDAGLVTVFQGAWTVDFVMLIPDGGIAGYLLAYGNGAAGWVNDNDNIQVQIGISAVSSTSIGGHQVWQYGAVVMWQSAGGAVQQATFPTGSWTKIDGLGNQWYYICVTKTLNGSNYDVALYVNGQACGLYTGVPNATGGTSANVTLGIGYQPDTGTVGGMDGILFCPGVDQVRISNIARSAAVISGNNTTLGVSNAAVGHAGRIDDGSGTVRAQGVGYNNSSDLPPTLFAVDASDGNITLKFTRPVELLTPSVPVTQPPAAFTIGTPTQPDSQKVKLPMTLTYSTIIEQIDVDSTKIDILFWGPANINTSFAIINAPPTPQDTTVDSFTTLAPNHIRLNIHTHNPKLTLVTPIAGQIQLTFDKQIDLLPPTINAPTGSVTVTSIAQPVNKKVVYINETP